MFKGVYSVLAPKRPRSVNSAGSASPKRLYSNEDLSASSLRQSSAFFDNDVNEQGIHTPANELTAVDSSDSRGGGWLGSKIFKESHHPTEEEGFIPGGMKWHDSTLSLNQGLREETMTDDREDMKDEEDFPANPLPTEPDVLPKSFGGGWPLSPKPTHTNANRGHTKHEEAFPASPIPSKPAVPTNPILDNWPYRTSTKPTTHAKSPSDGWLLPRPTDNVETKAPPKLTSSINVSPINLTFTPSDSTTAHSEYEMRSESSMDQDPSPITSPIKPEPQEKQAPKMQFKGFVNGVATFRMETNTPGNDSNLQNKDSAFPQEKSVRKMSSFLRKMVSKPESNTSPPSASRPLTNPVKEVSSDPIGPDPREWSPSSPPPPQEREEADTNRPRRKQHNSFAMLQPIVESTTFIPKPEASPTPFGSSLYGVDSTFAKRMEEAGRLRRLQSQSRMDLKADNSNTPPPPIAKSQKHARSISERTPSSSGSAPNTPLEEISNTRHQGIRHTVPPATPPKTPAKISPVVSHSEQDSSPRNSNSPSAELQALRDQLTDALRDKQSLGRELTRVTTQSASERDRLVRELRTLKQDNTVLDGRADQLARQKDSMSTELTHVQAELRKLTAEKRGWQEQLDTMHHKVVQAERQIRCLDHLTRAKLEAREEAVFGLTKRTKLALAQKRSSEEVISAVTDLNEEILQAANLLIENLDRTRFYGSITESSNKAEKVVGTHVTEMLKVQAGSNASGFRQLLMLVIMEVFLVHWCSAIIEGFYPKRPSFADLLVELSSHTTTTTAIGCGKQLKVVETQSSATIAVQFPTWASEIIRDLADILLVGGLKMRAKRQDVFKSKIQSIIALAYDLRAGLAEKDICGGLELVVVSPDSPFQPKWMQEGHTTERRGTTTMLTQMEAIAGTTGLGLKRPNVGAMPNDAYTYPLKPKVVLARVLRESLTS
ncbi:hypothetical protein M413DRAFT_20979 [Hebeloma cylindrosporum]|uniref:Uncharacterized protein n=1 Tax=Hebeloma cylindrosporum TaxID=76867 RepID=A0A0C3CIW8_HEBCY|nr:hypothetical protein M413DRAFT_20979 [Hebeloma cylindrosporum h7]